jgi:ribonucleoside-diphosphate reductase alpha chain
MSTLRRPQAINMQPHEEALPVVKMTDPSANALRVLEARYLLRDGERRVIETPARLFERVAHAVAETEVEHRSHWAQRFHALVASGEFLPNT